MRKPRESRRRPDHAPRPGLKLGRASRHKYVIARPNRRACLIFATFFLILALLGFYAFGVPLQRLARRRGWALSRNIPVLFSRDDLRPARAAGPFRRRRASGAETPHDRRQSCVLERHSRFGEPGNALFRRQERGRGLAAPGRLRQGAGHDFRAARQPRRRAPRQRADGAKDDGRRGRPAVWRGHLHRRRGRSELQAVAFRARRAKPCASFPMSPR